MVDGSDNKEEEVNKTPLELLDELIALIEPMAETGNIWAVGWRLRLQLVSAFSSKNEEAINEVLGEFKTSLQSLWDTLTKLFAFYVEAGLIDIEEQA